MDVVDEGNGAGVIERSASHFLTREPDGWALWSVDQDDDEPLITFPPDAAGEERARSAFVLRSRETRRVRFLAWAALFAGVVVLSSRVAYTLYDLFAPEEVVDPLGGGLVSITDPFSSKQEVLQVMTSVYSVAYATFLVAVGLFVVVWIQRRWRREG